jgi:rifampicin phosphotransferase
MKNTSIVWDKTNIGENYPGITTPLTYSFIRRAYARVYPNFLSMVGVNSKTLQENNTVFSNLIGYVDGQVYYNINNWYKMLKLLPGYKYNKEFFETMLNPVKSRKEQKSQNISPTLLWKNRSIIFHFAKAIVFIKPYYQNFEKDYSNHLAFYKSTNVKSLDVVSFIEFFKELQTRFFTAWRYTILNDFRVMIYYGLFTRCVKKYLPHQADNIMINLYGVHSKPESVALLKTLTDIAIDISRNIPLKQLFQEDTSRSILKALHSKKYSRINNKILRYIDEYGERTFNELKLEEDNFIQNNELFIDLLKQYSYYSLKDLQRLNTNFTSNNTTDIVSFGKDIPWYIRPIYNYLAQETIRSIHKREEYRLKRSKVFGIAKQMLKKLSKHLVDNSEIANRELMYYFYLDELFDYLTFHRNKERWNTVLTERKKQLYRDSKNLYARRVTTTGTPNSSSVKQHGLKHNTKSLDGTITAKGRVTNVSAAVMNTLDFHQKVNGRVLVTETTDPGWTVLFPLIKGVIIEKGGMLSHASIVAREMGIPCMVIPDATSIIRTGDVITLDTDRKKVYVKKKD